MQRPLALLLSAALVVAACGGDDDGTDTDTSTAPTTTTADTTTGTTDPTAAPSTTEPATTDGSDEAGDDERCERNRDVGTITFVTGFDFSASAGIIETIVADAEGYFDELCLDVEIQPGFAPANGALVIEGKAQMSAAASFAELVRTNLAGDGDLVALLHLGRTAIEAIVVPEGSEIESFGDLCGKLVGIKGDLPPSLQAAVGLAGADRSCFEEVLLDGFDPVAHLELGIDALPVYKSNEPNTLTNQGVPFTLLDPLDFDVPSSFAIPFTSRRFLDEHPEAVQDFVRALLRGFEFAAANPEAAVDHAFDLIDAAGNPLFFAKESELFRWNTESALVVDLAPDGVGIGVPDVERLGEEIDAMVDSGVFDEQPDWEPMVDPSIAESVYDGATLVWPGP